MKNKYQYLLYSILILNIIFIGLYSYDKYFRKLIAKPLKDKISIISSKTDYSKLKELNYGDKFPNHSIQNIEGQVIDISDLNNKYKFIEYITYTKGMELRPKIEFYDNFYKLQKDVNSNNIQYIFIFEGATINRSDERIFKKIQEKYNVNIALINDSTITSLYNIQNRGCGGFSSLLDENNIVRFINSNVSLETIIKIIQNELNKTGVKNEYNYK